MVFSLFKKRSLYFLLSGISGLFTPFASPRSPPLNAGIPYIVLITLVPLFYVLFKEEKSGAESKFWPSFLIKVLYILVFGIVFHCINFSWFAPSLENLTGLSKQSSVFIFISLSPLFAVYYIFLFSPLLFLGQRSVSDKNISTISILAIVITTLEISLPRNIQWSFAQSNCGIYFLQLASLFGNHTITFVILFINLSLAKILAHHKNVRMIKRILIINCSLVMCVLLFGYSRIKLLENDDDNVSTIRVAYIQPNFDLQILRTKNKDNDEFIIKKLLQLIDDAFDKSMAFDNKKPDLLIWPESVGPYRFLYYQNKSKIFIDKSRELDVPFLAHDNIWANFDLTKISSISFLITPTGISRQWFAKWVPMPFGEHLPFERLFGERIKKKFNIAREFEFGKSYKPLNVLDKFNVAPLICFDSISQNLPYKQVKSGAHFFANQSSFALLGKSHAIYQFINVDRNRAVENARSIILVNNRGPSIAFDHFGRQLRPSSKMHTEFFDFVDIPLYAGHSLFSYVYHWPLIIGAILGIIYSGIKFFQNSLPSTSKPKKYVTHLSYL